MKPLFAALLATAISAVSPVASQAQTLFNYNFSDVTTSSGTSSAGGIASNLTFSSFSANTSDLNSGVAGLMSFDNWPTGATTGSETFTGTLSGVDYYEFTITPNSGFSYSLAGLTFTAGRSGTGPRQFAVRSSLDSYGANLGGSTTNASVSMVGPNIFQFTDTTGDYSGNSITLGSGGFTGVTSPLTFRIYGFNSEGASGTFRLDNMAISGTVSAIPEPSTYAAIVGGLALAGTMWWRRRHPHTPQKS